MVTFTVMAHPEREEYAEVLSEKLNCGINYDYGAGLWENAKECWKDGITSDYHFLIQDDAILCENFKQKVTDLVDEYGNKAYCLYAGENLKSLQGKYDSTVLHNKVHWGVANGLPSSHIKDFLEFGDKWNRSYGTKHCDTRLSRYCRKVGLEVVYPYPSFVDHRQIPSLVGDSRGRKAYKFEPK